MPDQAAVWRRVRFVTFGRRLVRLANAAFLKFCFVFCSVRKHPPPPPPLLVLPSRSPQKKHSCTPCQKTIKILNKDGDQVTVESVSEEGDFVTVRDTGGARSEALTAAALGSPCPVNPSVVDDVTSLHYIHEVPEFPALARPAAREHKEPVSSDSTGTWPML